MTCVSREEQVLQFQKAMGSAHSLSFCDPDYQHLDRVLDLNMELISEEYTELYNDFMEIKAHLHRHETPPKSLLANFLKELSDLQYVISHMANAFGLPLGVAFNRVHLSNMSKLDDNGNPVRRADGKVMKGPNYKPAYLGDLV